jgi:Glyoxalase-like domain
VTPPRIRQAVLAARDLDAVAGTLRAELGLGEPFADPGVEYFGLRNAVFALGDTFLEVVSPVREGTSAGRLLERRGGDCGYMVMFQIDDLDAARTRASEAGVREVFEVNLEDIQEVHLHPADMQGAIVSLSTPSPAQSWRWGGPSWEERGAPVTVEGVTIACSDPDGVRTRWQTVIGGLGGASFHQDEADRGPVEIALSGRTGGPVEIGGVRFVPASTEEVSHD